MPPENIYVLADSPEEAQRHAENVVNFVESQVCDICGKPFGQHWAPDALCAIDETVTPETATRFTLKR